MREDCVFCKIIDGTIPSYRVFEDEDFLAFLDIAPWTKGHVVLIPKKHCRGLLDADHEILAKMLVTASKIASKLKDVLSCEGFNILQNNEPAAGQTVFHLHMHIIPRYKNDTVKIHAAPAIYKEGEAETLITQFKL